MAREFSPTVLHAPVVSHLLAGKPIREIARLLGQNPTTILRTVRRLEKQAMNAEYS